MKKKIILGLAATGTALALLPLLAAFEAHVINVTATIENALSVPVNELTFGTVFPQEKLDKTFDVLFSDSFRDEGQTRATDVEYVIRQKPKCALIPNGETSLPPFGQVTEDPNNPGKFICKDEVNYDIMPLLCPYLSKREITKDPTDQENDSSGIGAFHGLPGPWTLNTTVATQVFGKLDKVAGDNSDTWNIDLKVPCFRDSCAQDWPDFVRRESGSTSTDPLAYEADPSLEHALFGCDLWLEVVGVNTQVIVQNSSDFNIDNQNLGPNPLGSSVTGSSTYQYSVRTISSSGSSIPTVKWKVTVEGPAALAVGDVHIDERGWKDIGPNPDSSTIFHYPMTAVGGNLVAVGSCTNPDPDHSDACTTDDFDVDPNDDFTNVDQIHFDDNAPDGTYTIKRQLVDTETGNPLSNELTVAVVTK